MCKRIPGVLVSPFSSRYHGGPLAYHSDNKEVIQKGAQKEQNSITELFVCL